MNTLLEQTKIVIGTPVIADSGAGTDVNGAAIDRLGYDTAIMLCQAGVAGGTLSAATYRLQESDASGSGFADCTVPVSGTIVASTANKVTVDLRPLKRYVRVVTKLTLSTSTMPVGTTLILGNPKTLPAA